MTITIWLLGEVNKYATDYGLFRIAPWQVAHSGKGYAVRVRLRLHVASPRPIPRLSFVLLGCVVRTKL